MVRNARIDVIRHLDVVSERSTRDGSCTTVSQLLSSLELKNTSAVLVGSIRKITGANSAHGERERAGKLKTSRHYSICKDKFSIRFFERIIS